MGNFGNLPSELMLDIFTRLPTETVLESKLVCKTWKNVIRLPSFPQMHSNVLLSNHSAANFGNLNFILVMDDISKELPKQFRYLEYDDESSYRVKRMNLNPPFEKYSLLGSCNGLICLVGLPIDGVIGLSLSGLPNRYTLDNSSTAFIPYICNPITREVVTLPGFDTRKYHLVRLMLCGFGYVASTNEYKVVRLYTFRRDLSVAQIDVYTLGSGKGWRDAGKLHNFSFYEAPNAVFVNGFLCWDFGNGRTAVYDLAHEIFVGDSDFGYWHLWPRVLEGHLCGHLYSEDRKMTDILLLKKTEDGLFGWCKEFSLTSRNSFNNPLAFTSNGTVLGFSRTKLHLYDLKSASSKMLEDFGSKIYYAIPHMNTLVSLKAFGEENTTTLE